jgi:hypothetical protein
MDKIKFEITLDQYKCILMALSILQKDHHQDETGYSVSYMTDFIDDLLTQGENSGLVFPKVKIH